MKRIIKNSSEPTALKQYRSTPGADYENMPTDVKDIIRNALYQEQGGICCYCMKQITLDYGNTKIEHFKPRNIYNGKDGKENLKLNYNNLLLACKGEEMDSYNNKVSCCDSKKGDSELLFVNPLNNDIESKFYYTRSGEITSHDENIKNEIKNILNLNNQTLKNLRKKVYEYIKHKINKAELQKKCSLGFLNNLHKFWYDADKNGLFKPFCMVAVYVIRKKIKEYTFKIAK